LTTAKAERAIPVVVKQIGRSILILRGQRVILDRELAAIYGFTTKRLNEQVMRNRDRFPEDFMFQLTAEEADRSRSQIATLKNGRGQNIKYRPYVFTEHGAIQAANVLNSPRAIAMGGRGDYRHSLRNPRADEPAATEAAAHRIYLQPR
jgi:hypothetical protein